MLLLTPPAALIVSIVGLVRGGNRPASIAGIVISGLSMLLFFGFPLLMMLCK